MLRVFYHPLFFLNSFYFLSFPLPFSCHPPSITYLLLLVLSQALYALLSQLFSSLSLLFHTRLPFSWLVWTPFSLLGSLLPSHPGPSLPYARSLPVLSSVGRHPSGCSLFFCHARGITHRKHNKDKHFLRGDGTPVRSLSTPRDKQCLLQAQPGFNLPWAALLSPLPFLSSPASFHVIPSATRTRSLFLFPNEPGLSRV